MSPKGRKSQSGTLWYTCDYCNCIFSRKNVQDHPSDCTSIDPCIKWKYPFIKDKMFYGFVEEKKNLDASSINDDIIYVSQSAMQLCQFVIGDNIVVNSKQFDAGDSGSSHCEVKIVWPTSDGSVTTIFSPKADMESSWGLHYGPAILSKLTPSPALASEIFYEVTRPSDISEKIDYFTSMLQLQLRNKVFHVNSRKIVNFYGKKIKLIVVRITPLMNEVTEGNVDELTNDFQKLQTDSKTSANSFGCAQFYKAYENTKWCLKNPKLNDDDVKKKKLVTLEDVGGYCKTIAELQEFIVRGTKKSTSGQYKNIKLATGVLLYGLHGTGKSLLAKALANDSGANVFNIHSGDLFSKFYGEAEARLQAIFKDALSKAPSVVVLDDIDTICSRRSNSDQERRVIATLLTSLDSLSDSSVFIIATTSQTHAIDPALRRPGRLDREIELPVPTRDDREDIIVKLLKHATLVDKEVVRKVASAAHGYVGADLCAVVASAYSRAVQRGGEVTSYLEWALTQIKPSAMREVYVEVPNVKWTDIGGQDHLKLQLQQAVEWPLRHPEAFIRLGITPPHGVLMFGPPGCSKTMIAKALATESKLNFISIKGPELFSKWVGESERAVRAVFKRARSVAPSIVFLDELDALAGERGDGSGNGGASVQERVLAQLLTELDGVEPLSNVTVVAATNRPDRIDKALLRPGRLDRLIYVPLPDIATRRQILELQFQRIPVACDVNIDDIGKVMEKYSGAEVVAVCHEAALNALEVDRSATDVKLCNFKYALNIVTPRTPRTLIDLYERYIAQ